MQLIGMLDSPYVRRVAISLQLLGLRFEHRSLSVFRDFDEFHRINPVVKAPTLVTDAGVVLMDSALILEYAESLVHPRSLLPASRDELERDQRVIGLALAACEKAVQIVYENELRPPEKRHQSWLTRITGQLLAAFGALEREIAEHPLAATSDTIRQAGISTAVAWKFTQALLPGRVPASAHPALAAFSARAESLAQFAAAPHGASTYRHAG